MRTNKSLEHVRHNYETKEEVEIIMNNILRKIHLTDWKIMWEPEENPIHGKILPNNKLICIYDEAPSTALETFIHEIIEIHTYEIIQPYRKLINTLITYIQELTYQNKEKGISKLHALISTLSDLNGE